MIIMKDVQRTPFASKDELRVTVPVQVTPNRAANQSYSFQSPTVSFIQAPLTTSVLKDPRRSGLGITAANNPATDEKLELAVSVHVGQCQRAHTRLAHAEHLA